MSPPNENTRLCAALTKYYAKYPMYGNNYTFDRITAVPPDIPGWEDRFMFVHVIDQSEEATQRFAKEFPQHPPGYNNLIFLINFIEGTLGGGSVILKYPSKDI